MNGIRLSHIAGLSLLLGASQVASFADEEAIIDLIPSEAIAVAHFRDAGSWDARMDDSALGRVWEHPKFRKWIAPAWTALEEEFSGDESVEAAFEGVMSVMEAFEGEAVLGLLRFPFQAVMQDAASGGDSDDPEVKVRRAKAMKEGLRVAAVGRVAENGASFEERCQEVLEFLVEEVNASAEGEKAPDRAEVVVEKVDEVEIHTLRLTNPKVEMAFDTLTFAHVGDVGLVGMPRETVVELIETIEKGAKRRLSDGSLGVFRKRNPDNDVHLHLNLEPLIEVALQAAEEAEKGGAFGLQAANLGLSVQGVHEALGLGDLQSFDVGLQLDPEQTVLDGAIQYTQRSGLMKLVAYTDGALPKTPFIPRDATAASVSRFSFEDMWQSLFELVGKAVPNMAPMIKQQLGAAEAQLGVSLEKDLFGNLQPEIITVQSSHSVEGEVPEDDMVLLFGLENEQGFEVAFGKILAMVSGMTGLAFEPSEYLDYKVQSLEIPAMGPGAEPQKLSYLFAHDYFIVSFGKGEALRKLLSNFERPGKALWDEPLVKEVLGRFEAGYCEINYVDIGSLLSGLGEMMTEVLGEENAFLDWNHLPTPEEWQALVGIMVSATYLEDNGIFSRALMLPNGQ